MSKPLILELKEKVQELEKQNLNVEILTGSIDVGINTYKVYTPDYSKIKGEIVGSTLIGGVSTANNLQMLALVPTIGGVGEQYSKVNSVLVKSGTNATIYINILVFYRKKIN